MDRKSYYHCSVALCKNTTIKTPEKLFIKVPNDVKMRKTWLQLARRDPRLLSITTGVYFCEDHFDLENDMENYIQYKVMGTVKKIRMIPGCLPSKFDCQPNRKKKTAASAPRSAFLKRQRMALIKEAESALKIEEITGITSTQQNDNSAATMENGSGKHIMDTEVTVKTEVEEAVASREIYAICIKEEPGLGQLVKSEPASLVKQEILENCTQGTSTPASTGSVNEACSKSLGDSLNVKDEPSDMDIGPTVLQHMDKHYGINQNTSAVKEENRIADDCGEVIPCKRMKKESLEDKLRGERRGVPATSTHATGSTSVARDSVDCQIKEEDADLDIGPTVLQHMDSDYRTDQLPNDMEYHIMGSVSQIRPKPGCTSGRFECQSDRRKRTCSSIKRPNILRKQKTLTIEECLNESEECTPTSGIQSSVLEDTPDASSELHVVDEDLQDARETADKSVQVLMKRKTISKAIQASVELVDRAVSPFESSLTCVSTSPFKLKYSIKSRPSGSVLSKISKQILMEHSYSDLSLYTPSVTRSESSSSTHSLQMKSTSDNSELFEEIQKQKTAETIQDTINKIRNKPRFCIGVPKNSYHLIDLIINEINIPEHHLLLCLNKIRLDDEFQGLADDFAMTSSYASKIFLKNVPIIASVMRPFIVKLDNQMIKKTLPMSFRRKYRNVGCIIDCLEIEIQKPSKAVDQALTWSDYKNAYTLKYLISYTPNGLVNFVSPGFGGRTTDVCLVESCDFIQCLERGMCVMVDRGFKRVEQYLQKSGVQLVRPPSVRKGVKLAKSESEAKQTKQIASLRIHVERIKRYIRQFSVLKPHACININFVKVLDDIVTITCALNNLQDCLVR